mmetsp:Transcript_10130/g.19552  ORF Transcript_10130/g.19552 Transcript_10130/m.19552 type:complete len:406 (+) Transcript_10130:3-1220(+)
MNRLGNRFRLIGVNWYGASDAYNVVGGLDVQTLEIICETVQQLGFNVVRLPFSNEMLRSSVAAGAVNFALNPQLRDLTPLQVLDEVIHCLGRYRIAVILNNHTTYSEWCGAPDRNGLWWDPASSTFSVEQWLEDWAMLATRYALWPHVVGYDLRNEVRPCPPSSFTSPWLWWPSLGSLRWPRLLRSLGGCDWASAAAAAAERVRAAPSGASKLIVIERIVWPAQSLHAYTKCPGPFLPCFSGQLVLGVHHYSWSGPGRYLAFGGPPNLKCLSGILRRLGIFSKANYGDMSRQSLFEELSRQWGFCLDEDICPVWVSEFGGNDGSADEMRWLRMFIDFLVEKDADWAYWPLNVGPKPDSGNDEPYGMLSAEWMPKGAAVKSKSDGGMTATDTRLDLLERAGLRSTL